MTATDKTIQVYCENNRTSLYVQEGTTTGQILDMLALHTPSPVVACFADNHMKELSTRIYSPKNLRYVELASPDGMRVYARSLFFLLHKALLDCYPNAHLRILHTASRGYYGEIDGLEGPLTDEQVQTIKQRMRALVELDLPIVREKLLMEDIEKLYHSYGYEDKLALLGTRPQYFITVYNLGGLPGYFYGAMVVSTGALKVFDLQPFGDGFVLLMPRREDWTRVEPMCLEPKLFSVFQQNKEWADILQISDVGSLNSRVLEGEASQMIKVGEALQEKTLARIADTILERHDREGVKIVFVAGPSSSGKTTLSKRLSIQLRVLGLEPQTISLDDYFVDREHTPRDENGNYDFEALEAVDIEAFNSDLNRLFVGERVEMPKFRFTDGKRYYDGTTLQLSERGILIVEGIHGLNPGLTPHVEEHLKFKIYASALTTLSLDNLSVISTTDNRLLRRIVRDSKYRGRSAYDTLKGWSSVRRGEDKYIFPYQEQADVMVNTALFFEISILKQYARPLLVQVPANTPEYAEALRLMKFLDYFVEIPDRELPPTSILREFLGGSSFSY